MRKPVDRDVGEHVVEQADVEYIQRRSMRYSISEALPLLRNRSLIR